MPRCRSARRWQAEECRSAAAAPCERGVTWQARAAAPVQPQRAASVCIMRGLRRRQHARPAGRVAQLHLSNQHQRSAERRRDVIAPSCVRPLATRIIVSRGGAPGASKAGGTCAKLQHKHSTPVLRRSGAQRCRARAAALQQLRRQLRGARERRRGAFALQPKLAPQGSLAGGPSRRERSSRAPNRGSTAARAVGLRRRAPARKQARVRSEAARAGAAEL